VLENEREIANIFTPPQKEIKRDAPPQEAIGKRDEKITFHIILGTCKQCKHFVLVFQ
jgi:hypothetical protein